MANIQSTITYNANLSPAQAQIKALTGQIAGLTAAFNTLDRTALKTQKSLASAFTANVGQIGGFTTQTIQAHNAVESFGKQLESNRLTMRQYFREAFAGYAKQNSMMKQLAIQQVRYQQSVAVPMGAGQMALLTPTTLAATGNAAAIASQKFAIFNKLIDGGATAMLNWGKNTQWAGRQLMVGFTVPLAMFTAVASKQFRELDTELTRFQKVYGQDLGGTMSDATKRMRDEVKQLAFDISQTYGIAAKDTAALAADIAATGKEGQDLLNSVQQTTRLSVLGEVDRQDAMKATLALQSAFKLSTNDLADSINFLNAVENQTSTTLQDLTQAIPKVGPVIESLGGNVKDLSALLVAMREGGVPAAEAANALKSGLASLINPTKQASDVAKKFGVDLEGIVKTNKGELMPTIFAVQNALNGLDAFSKSQVIEQIFGKYQFARMSALFDNLGKAGSQTQAVFELAAKNSTQLAGIANQELRTLTESTSVRFARAVEQLKNTIIPLGQTLTETFIPIFDTIAKGVTKFTDFFQSLPEPVKNFTKYIVAIGALAGPIIMMVGLFGNLIANGIKFGMMMVRMGARIAGLKIDKFELLNADVMAAKLGVDNLTQSFMTQESAMKRLVSVMSTYESSLRRLTTANPALFIPGAIPGRGGTVPIRRQSGSTRPEIVPGSGRGDHIPALLEPGEFVVNRSATQKYGHVLSAMNRGTIRGFQEGGSPSRLAHLTGSRTVPITSAMEVATPSARKVLEKMLQDGITEVKTFNNLVVNLSKATNDSLNTEKQGSGVRKSILTAELQEKERWSLMMKAAGASFDQLQPTIKGVTSAISRLEGELINDPQLYRIVETELIKLSEAGDVAAQRLLALSKQYGTVQYLRTDEGKVRPGRMALGVSTSGVGSYRSSRLAANSWSKESLLNLEKALDQAIAKAIQSSSPSKKADQIGDKAGKSIGDGVIDGLQRGINTSTSKKVAAGPVGPGLESRPLSDATRREINARNVLEKALIKETQQQGLITDTKLRMQSLQKNHNVVLENWTKDLVTGQWIHKNGLIAEKERTAVLEKLAQEEQLLVTQNAKLASIVTIRERAEKNATVAAEAKASADKQSAQIVVQRALQQGSLFTPGSYFMGGTSPYAPSSVGPTSRFGNLTSEERKALAAQRRVGAGYSAERPGDLRKAVATPTSTSEKVSGSRGAGAVNAAMGISMALSAMTMFSGATGEAANKLMMFSSTLTTAMFAIQSMQGFGIGGKMVKGVSALGGGISNIGSRMVLSSGGTVASSLATRGVTAAGGAGMMGRVGGLLASSGGALAGGGGAAIAATAGVAAAVAAVGVGLYLYKKSLDEARERAIAAFQDPVATVNYFGESITNVTDILKNIQAANASQELADINTQLKEAVKSDYAGLIEKIKNSVVTVGSTDLAAAYNQMLVSGLSADQALESIKAIAAEAGVAGGAAYAKAFGDGLLSSKSPEEAFGQMLDMIDPNSAYNKGRMASLQADRAAIKPTVGYRGYAGYTQAQKDQLGSIDEAMKISGESFYSTLKASIDLSQTAPEKVAESLDKIKQSYVSLSTDAGANLFGMGQSSQEVAFDSFKNMIGELKDPRLNQIIDSLGGQSPEIQALAMQIVAIGGDLNDAADASGKFNVDLANAALNNARNFAYLNQNVKDATNSLIDFANNTQIQSKLEKGQDAITKISDARDAYAKSREKQRKAEEEAFTATQDVIQNEIDALTKEQKAIQKTSDKYIKSLQSRAKADDFYAKQRQTSLGALSKLASGDVFGFLQERTNLSSQAQQYSYDQEIQRIQDRRDLETEAIQQTIDKKQELMDLNAKAHDDQMKAFDEETKKHMDALDKQLAQQSAHNSVMKKLIDGVAKGEIQNFENIRKEFGLSLALRYKDLVNSLVKETAAKLQAQITAGDIEIEIAKQQMVQMYQQMYGPGLGYGNVSTYDQLLQTFGIGAFYDRIGAHGPVTGTGVTGQATGGYISGPGGPKSDIIPAMLSNGEYVVKASSVGKYGRSMMDAINAGKYADGGLVDSLNKWMPKNKLSFYQGWDQYTSWGGGKPSGIMMHHTAGLDSLEWMARTGRTEYGSAPGPVVQAYIAKNGLAHILAGGALGWGAGEGSTAGFSKDNAELAKEIDDLGGASNALWQIETESLGLKKDFTAEQFDSIARMTAAIREWSGWSAFDGRIINHKDWAPNRKIDTLYDKSVFINNANKIWGGGSTPQQSNDNQNNNAISTSPTLGPKQLAGILSLVGTTTPNKRPVDGGGGSTSPGTGKILFKTPLPEGASLSDAKTVLKVVQSTWPRNLWKVGWTIAMRESLGQNIGPGHPRFNGDDYGIFQINKPTYGNQSWWSDTRLLDPLYNAKSSWNGVSNNGSTFLPWAMKIGNNGGSYSWDWSLYGGEPDFGRTWTVPVTGEFWNSWIQKANGGYISGPGGPRSDIIPALLSNGEYVMKANAVGKYGKGFMDQVNAGTFSLGGMVGSPTYSMPQSPSNTVNVQGAISHNSSINNSNKVNIVINGVGGKSATAIANKVVSMINSSNSRRNHSRSI